MKVSVIIPYFQREPGILRRALTSILCQQPPGAVVVIVVDDGSPIAAEDEINGLTFTSPFSLKVIKNPNGGVAKARNTGLDAVDADTVYIAFLDSDDIWHEGHLNTAIAALEAGADFYFCDNESDSHHASYFAECSPLATAIIKEEGSPDCALYISKETISTMILKDFVSQASTTLYRYSCAPDHRFNTAMRNAGEDIVFFLSLVARMKRFCFSPKIMVTCGDGINLYFSNLSWNSEGYSRRLVDGLRAHMLIKKEVTLSKDNAYWNDTYIAKKRRAFAFHFLRSIIKNKGKLPTELMTMSQYDDKFYKWLTVYAVQAAIGKSIGIYKPE